MVKYGALIGVNFWYFLCQIQVWRAGRYCVILKCEYMIGGQPCDATATVLYADTSVPQLSSAKGCPCKRAWVDKAASCTRFCCSRPGRLGTWCETARVCEGADWGECTENVDAMLVDESRGDSSEDYGNVTAFAALATDDTRRRAPYVEGTSEAFFERTPVPTPAPESSFWWYVGWLRTYVLSTFF